MTKKTIRPRASTPRPPPQTPRSAARSRSAARPHNRLLAALPAADYQRLLPDLKVVPLRAKQVLYRQGDTIRHVYFPNGGVVSVTTMLSDGTSVEAGTIGDEGMVGIEVFLVADAVSPGEAIVQVPDTDGVRLSVDAFRRETAFRGALHDSIGRFTQVVIAQMMQTTACNALHPVQERCARWLLMTHDRMHERDFRLSQEFLAIMLGVQRSTVSAVAGSLQKAGLIRYTHGRITVTNRKGLEAAACECYPTIRASFDRLRK